MRTARSSRSPVNYRPSHGLVLVLAGFALLAALPAALQAETSDAGMVLRVPPGKIMEVAERLNQAIDKPFKRFEKERAEGSPRKVFRLICDFNPSDQDNSSDKFGPCSDLADKLRDLQKSGIQTTA